MKKLWRELIDCGIKAVGTEAHKKAEDLMFAQLKNISEDAYKMEFTFDGWGSSGTSELFMTSPIDKQFATWVFLGSGNGKFEGELRYVGTNVVWTMYRWDRYGIFKDDKLVAYVSGRPDGRLISQTLVEGNSDLPHFIVDKNDNNLIKQLLAAKVPIKIRGEAKTYTDKKMRGCNLILPIKGTGKSDKKIIVCGHYDTMYNTKGAFDNGTGAVLVVEMAKRLSQNPLEKDVIIALMDGEECRLEGAKYFASQTNPEDIDYLVNIDGIGRGDTLEIWCGYESFEKLLIEKLLDDFTFSEKVYINPPPPGSDHAPFYDMGVDVCELTLNDQDLLHMPEDDYRESLLEGMEKMIPIIDKVLTLR